MKPKRNFWPYAIILYFVIFIGAMTAWIVFATRNDQELVRKDYYEQELKYQGELERTTRASVLPVTVAYDSSTKQISIALPANAETGTIYFYRPSRASLDRELPLALSDGAQTIDVSKFEQGLWKLRLAWKAGGVEFRRDESLVL
jgi:hypothetical protein